ncbi:MAG TPA: ATP-binding protein [Candidatus Saccharimonadales bacterium]|nr:ATP-binding protein [Candidatus Saccharimonadales bacterium]
MNLELIVAILSGMAMAVLALIVLTRNPTDIRNKRFAFVAVSTIIWVAFIYLSDHVQIHDPLYTRLAFIGSVFWISSLVLFVRDFPNKIVFSSKLVFWSHYVLTVILLPVIFTPSFIESVGADSITTGPTYQLFIFYVAYSLLLFGIIARKQLTQSSSQVQRTQVMVVFGSVAVYAALTATSNVLIPLIFDDWASSRLGPVFSLIFIAGISFSIIRFRLFDIKFLIVRSTGYMLALAMVAALSFILLVWLSGIFDRFNATIALRTNAFVLITIVLAVLYQPFKRVFERLTNRIFYKDAYDTRTLIDEFNRAIVATIVLNKLLHNAATTIEKFIKPQDVSFIIRDQEQLRSVSKTIKPDKELLAEIDSHLATLKDTILTTDALEDNKKLKSMLQQSDIGIVAKMVVGKGGGSKGYMILGYKKSGDNYSSQDREAVKILANGLSIAVQNALRFEEIERFNATLQEKIEDATRELRRKNERLRVLDQTKDDFISMASHQLRTPLTSVKGYVSMVLDGDAGKVNDLQKKLLNQSFLSSQRMVYLISDLLNVSRLRTGKFIIEPVESNLADVIESEVEQLQETSKSRDLTLTYNKPEHFPTLLLDENKLRQVIMNFIDNAIYYTLAGGHISVALTDKPESVEFTVVDDGIGVPKHEQHHLFSKFYRAHNAKRARPDGTGLGLFMAKKVIIAQGGAIIFKSQENKGSTFGFSFPKRKLLKKDETPQEKTQKS